MILLLNMAPRTEKDMVKPRFPLRPIRSREHSYEAITRTFILSLAGRYCCDRYTVLRSAVHGKQPLCVLCDGDVGTSSLVFQQDRNGGIKGRMHQEQGMTQPSSDRVNRL